MEQEVSLIQMLDARERRVWHQQELLGAYGKPLVCFTMNIAGPVKDSPLIRRGFARGRQLLERQFLRCGIKPLKIDLSKAVTGPEAFYVLDAEPLTIKKLTTLVEDASPLGRLFDMDVLRPDGKKVDREELHLGGRKCLICGGPAKVCSSRRVHPVSELQARTTAILTETMDTLDAATAARQAVRASNRTMPFQRLKSSPTRSAIYCLRGSDCSVSARTASRSFSGTMGSSGAPSSFLFLREAYISFKSFRISRCFSASVSKAGSMCSSCSYSFCASANFRKKPLNGQCFFLSVSFVRLIFKPSLGIKFAVNFLLSG